VHLLPTIWFRNTWTWNCNPRGCSVKPRIALEKDNRLALNHETLGKYLFEIGPDVTGAKPENPFTVTRPILQTFRGGE